ncbi:kinase-like domain-containing protein [Dichotomocladium elegans]|nr:kinase-like domain-containing protein [Dichotomocladium elegans]
MSSTQESANWADAMVDRIISSANSQYQLLEELGRGSYGCLFLGQVLQADDEDDAYVAVKVLSKGGLDISERQLQQLEADIQSELHHDHILALHSVIQDDDYIFMVMELCDQGDLFDFVINSKDGLDEALVKRMFLQILDAVEYMHSKGIYHRDIKLENILLKSDELTCKVADFGLATRERFSMEYGCGSSTYLAPEHFDEADNTNMTVDDVPYDAAASDVWSLGVLLIALLFGRNPWQEASMMDPAFAEYRRNPAMLKDQLFPTMSTRCHQFLRMALAVDAHSRPSVAELKQVFVSIPQLTAEEDEQSAVDIPAACPKQKERASFDSAIFSAKGMSWSDMVDEEEEMLESDKNISSDSYDEEDTDMFIHQDEKESWWM